MIASIRVLAAIVPVLLVILPACQDDPVSYAGFDVVPVDALDATDSGGGDVHADADAGDVDSRDGPDSGPLDTGPRDTSRDVESPDTAPDSAETCGSFRVLCRPIESETPFGSTVTTQTETEVLCGIDWVDEPSADVIVIEWDMVAVPDDSNAGIEPDQQRAVLFVDVGGTYRVGATAVGTTCSARGAGATIEARTQDEMSLRVSLTWETPGDDDLEDTFGADVDLHFLSTEGCWDDARWDVHWRNMSPDWGPSGSDPSDPVMVRDDTNGEGPEIVEVEAPSPGTYLIAAMLWIGEDFGPTSATARISLGSLLVFEAGPQELESDGQWWVIGSLSMPSAEFTPLDALYAETPSCP